MMDLDSTMYSVSITEEFQWRFTFTFEGTRCTFTWLPTGYLNSWLLPIVFASKTWIPLQCPLVPSGIVLMTF